MKLVLMRGLAREALHWGEFPAQLAQTLQMSDKEILCPDFSGCGKYYQEPAATTITAMTDHVRQQVIPSLKKSDKIIVIGLSMGGMVAMDWLYQFPEEIAGVVLINSSLGSQPFWWRLRPVSWGRALVSLFASTELREKMMLRAVSNDVASYEKHEQTWLDIQKQHRVSLKSILCMLIAAARFRCNIQASKIPGLVLASKQDRLVSHQCSRQIADRYQWPLHVHASAGHDLPMDDAQWVCEEIKRWLERHSNHFNIA